jgi:hypothetical protein
MYRWDVYGLDVWGNEEDGFEVNDSWKIGSVRLGEDPTDEEITSALIGNGYLKSRVTADQLDIDGDDMSLFVSDIDTGEPVFNMFRYETD